MNKLAEYLKSERSERNLPLARMSELTGISHRMLQALEEGDGRRFGSPFLIRGFVRSYCSGLGIDPDPVLAKHADEIEAYDCGQETIKRYAKWAAGLRRKRRAGILTALFLAVAAVGALGGGFLIAEKRAQLAGSHMEAEVFSTFQELPPELQQKLRAAAPVAEVGRDAGKEPVSKTLDGDPVKVVSKTALMESTPVPAESNAALQPLPSTPRQPAVVSSLTEVLAEDKPVASPSNVQYHSLVIEAAEKSWVQITTDDRKTESVMLYPGDRREWKAEKGVQVVVGNMGGVIVQWNGKPLGISGKSGRVLRFRLPDPQLVANR